MNVGMISEKRLIDLDIGFALFFYMTRVRMDWNTGEVGIEYKCVLFKHTRVFATKRERTIEAMCTAGGVTLLTISESAFPGHKVVHCESVKL